MSQRFFDTNVILPSLDRNHVNHEKSTALLSSLGAERPCVSVTVLGELYVGVTKARAKGGAPLLGHATAREVVAALAEGFTVRDVTSSDWTAAMHIKRRYVHWGIWDCLIWASAKAAGCSELLTEDAPGGLRQLEGVRFVNPFGS